MLEKLDFSKSPTMWGGTRKILAISLDLELPCSRNCACSARWRGRVFQPLLKHSDFVAVCRAPELTHQESRTLWRVLDGSRMLQHTAWAARHLAKNLEPYSSVAMARPMAFFAIAMGGVAHQPVKAKAWDM